MDNNEIKTIIMQATQRMLSASPEEIDEDCIRGIRTGLYYAGDQFCNQVRTVSVGKNREIILTLVRNTPDNFPFLCVISLAEPKEDGTYDIIEEDSVEIWGNREMMARDWRELKKKVTEILEYLG